MVVAGAMLKSLYPNLFHVTCVAHLWHSCAIKIKCHFEDADQLIAKVKSVTVQSKTGQAKFAAICRPSPPIVTRRGRWINAALYYAKDLSEVNAIVESFKESVILVTQAKVSLQTSGLAAQLFKIKDQHECLVKLIETMKSVKNTIKKAAQAIQEFDF